MSKSVLCLVAILSLAAVLAPRAIADTACIEQPNYLNLTPMLEKWFTSDYPGKSVDLRMHTAMLRTWNGIAVQHREILLGNEVVEEHELLFSRDPQGDIHYHGDLTERVLAEPVKWVDSPLSVGKSWTDRTPAFDNGVDPGQVIHFVFAVLEQETVLCPSGPYPAYRVMVTTVYPDGRTTNCNFWYNERCGMVRCCMENQRVYLLQKVIDGRDDPGRDFVDPVSLLPEGAASVPNPSNPTTDIRFRLAAEAPVTIEIYDLAGRRIRSLCTGERMTAGQRSVRWDGRNDAGSPVASGIYLYRVRAGGETTSDRVTLVR